MGARLAPYRFLLAEELEPLFPGSLAGGTFPCLKPLHWSDSRINQIPVLLAVAPDRLVCPLSLAHALVLAPRFPSPFLPWELLVLSRPLSAFLCGWQGVFGTVAESFLLG